MQHTSHLLMIRPVQFAFNAETAVNNSFQVRSADTAVQEKALQEFNDFISMLTNNGIDVTAIDDTPAPHTPDSVFPNNWISFHEDGTVFLYPMFAVNRRLERKAHVLETIGKRFYIKETVDLSPHETTDRFLEGTGSMVLDRDNKIVYACLSPRTDKTVLQEFCDRQHYTPVCFTSVDESGQPIYHTNVMMCVADAYVVICVDSVPDQKERENLIETIHRSGKELIPISFDQMNHFSGNMLQVHTATGDKKLVMSSQAYHSLTAEQLARIRSFNPILHADITTIETNGGGSARCMMAEIFLPAR